MPTREELDQEYLKLSRQLKSELSKLEEKYQKVEKVVGDSILFTPAQRKVYHEWMDQLRLVKKIGEQLEEVVKRKDTL